MKWDGASVSNYKVKDNNLEIGNALFNVNEGKAQIDNGKQIVLDITKNKFQMIPLGKGTGTVTAMTIVVDTGPNTKTIASYGIFCDGLYSISGSKLINYAGKIDCNNKKKGPLVATLE